MSIFPLALIISIVWSLPNANIDPSEYKTIVVIPDVHGDYYAAVMSLWIAYQQTVDNLEINLAEFKRILRQAIMAVRDTNDELVVTEDMKIPPSTGKIALVQLGDVIDRGPENALMYFKSSGLYWVGEF